ncbi:uncharacterized protein YALI1_A01230g [Yarrowia lipolytica]|uniref:Uncharacterized protein n=1 Tax=Yarrowia lipolytica TaxID=4952 RepID=A0A1D8N3A3_YARLL|nr:hypothetical protein YALI1_A01230g [Yarrowia lipolytica]
MWSIDQPSYKTRISLYCSHNWAIITHLVLVLIVQLVTISIWRCTSGFCVDNAGPEEMKTLVRESTRISRSTSQNSSLHSCSSSAVSRLPCHPTSFSLTNKDGRHRN